MIKNYTTKRLETQRLVLRKFSKDDYEDMFNNWASNPIVAKQAGFPCHTDIMETKKLVEFWISEYKENCTFNWIIEIKNLKKAIGSITVVNKDLVNKNCEIGYNIGEAWWNNGYVTEAINAILDYLFSTKMFNVVTANCHDYNIASAKVLEKNNFKKEGILKDRKIIDKKNVSLIQYSITKEEYLIHLKNIELKKYHKWLNITTTVEDYIEPNYYNKLLKKYIFENKSDLEIFNEWLNKNQDKTNILELGCGSGRVSDVFIKNYKGNNYSYELLDLSKDMLEFTKNRFQDYKFNYIESDTIDYLYDTNKKYDLVFSLWSFSHSVHQQFHKYGLIVGGRYVKNAMKKFIKENLKKDGKMFLIHFDSLSEEQKILMKQWKRVYPTFENIKEQSPSFQITKEVLEELRKDGIINFTFKHYKGKKIEYKNVEEALEIFINFHMESYFNDRNDLSAVYEDVEKYLKKREEPNGHVSIEPGCFIFTIDKN